MFIPPTFAPLLTISGSGSPVVVPDPYVDIPLSADYSDVSGGGHPMNNFSGTRSIVADGSFPRSGGSVLEITSGYAGPYYAADNLGNNITSSFWAKGTTEFFDITAEVFYQEYITSLRLFSNGAVQLGAGGINHGVGNPPDYSHEWTHYAFVESKDNFVKVYVNGVLSATEATTWSIARGITTFFRVGKIARLRIWKSILTADEIVAEYNRA